jgi:DNA-binding transcriptional LysR family regulator
VRIELTTGTNDALTAAVLDRRLDAAFVAEPAAATSSRTCRCSPSGSSSSPRAAPAGAPPKDVADAIGDRLSERLRVPAPPLPLARRDAARDDRACSTSARTTAIVACVGSGTASR